MENVARSSDRTDVASQMVPVSVSEYEEFLRFKKERAFKSRIKDLGQKFFAIRQTLVMRRADVKSLAPVEDVLAYDSVYHLKEAVTLSGKKIAVSDQEVAVYRELEAEGVAVTLALLDARIKAAGVVADPSEGSDEEQTTE